MSEEKIHIPKEWIDSDKSSTLMDHSMIHDYLYYMIKILFNKNKEIYITKSDIESNSDILRLLGGAVPDFIIKKRNGREKTLIIDIYSGCDDSNNILNLENKYENLDFFSDFIIITSTNFRKVIAHILPYEDTKYLCKNFRLFLNEYLNLIKHKNPQINIFNGNIPITRVESILSKEASINKSEYISALVEYSQRIANTEHL